MDKPQIILLNGVGSVGKTSVARAVQEIAATPLLHVSMDAFMDMVPAKLIGHLDGITFETSFTQGAASTSIRTGDVVERALSGMRHAIVALAGQGNRLIVDDVWLGCGEAAEYHSLLAAYEVRVVGLFAPLDVIEERERSRKDRTLGLARWEFDRVHVGVNYDLEIETTSASPSDIAWIICRTFRL
ncbi:MAG: hypothetical protein WA840_03780 [Caulobacteraceae bacterium]